MPRQRQSPENKVVRDFVYLKPPEIDKLVAKFGSLTLAARHLLSEMDVQETPQELKQDQVQQTEPPSKVVKKTLDPPKTKVKTESQFLKNRRESKLKIKSPE